jgi:hypothetical protein
LWHHLKIIDVIGDKELKDVNFLISFISLKEDLVGTDDLGRIVENAVENKVKN